MLDELTDALRRTSPTLWRDLVGMAALAVVILGGLHLPALLGAV